MQRTIQTEIVIQAPVQQVWHVLTDLESYAQWNPFIQRAHGKIVLGETIHVEPSLGKGRLLQMQFDPKIIRYVFGKEFAWTGKDIHPALFADQHSFVLQSLHDGSTRLVHNEYFYGIGGVALAMISKRRIQQGFSAMNHALKARVEAKL